MKVTIIDYIGYCDEEKKPIGHSLKALNDYAALLRDKLSVRLVIPAIYKNYIDGNYETETVGIDIAAIHSGGKREYLLYLARKMLILRGLLRRRSDERLWFINTDFWLFVALFLFRSNGNRIFVTRYIKPELRYRGMKAKLFQWIIRTAEKKIEYIFTTDRQDQGLKHRYLPDFFYDEHKYAPFVQAAKQEQVVFLGSMNKAKDIEGVIRVFNKNKIPLLISGKFDSTAHYEEIRKIAQPHIQLTNGFLSEEEYLSLLARAKYVILPYRHDQYANRSSGVILEAVFLETVVIAPRFLLEYTGIQGIGYDSIDELEQLQLEQVEVRAISGTVGSSDNRNKVKDYDKNNVKDQLLDLFTRRIS